MAKADAGEPVGCPPLATATDDIAQPADSGALDWFRREL